MITNGSGKTQFFLNLKKITSGSIFATFSTDLNSACTVVLFLDNPPNWKKEKNWPFLILFQYFGVECA